MKKAIVIPLLILLVLLSFALYNSHFMEQNTTLWYHQLQETSQFLEDEDWMRVESALKESYANWSVRQTYLHIVSTHDTIHEAEAMYQRALAFSDAREPSELQAELAALQSQVVFLAEMERLSLHNIF